jgi:hypothetical protein
MDNIPTVREIFQIISDCDPQSRQSVLWLHFGDFLDYFYHQNRTHDERYGLLAEEPEDFYDIPQTTYAFMASSVHKLCDDYMLPPPAWVFHEKYYLKDPYFSLNAKGDLRLILITESPVQFKMRHIFTSSNTLSRA